MSAADAFNALRQFQVENSHHNQCVHAFQSDNEIQVFSTYQTKNAAANGWLLKQRLIGSSAGIAVKDPPLSSKHVLSFGNVLKPERLSLFPFIPTFCIP